MIKINIGNRIQKFHLSYHISQNKSNNESMNISLFLINNFALITERNLDD